MMSDDTLVSRYQQTRKQSLQACAPLCIEDYGLQAAAFASPPKWHLAHTSWFFETFLLQPLLHNYQLHDERYGLLFNSYYNGIGEQFSRAQRGLLSRPTVEEVRRYRAHIDREMERLLGDIGHPQRATVETRTRLGIEHEQQHQELFYTDLKYSLFANPLAPGYSGHANLGVGEPQAQAAAITTGPKWREYKGGLTRVGHDSRDAKNNDFAFDNESPAHSVYLAPYALARQLVSNAEYQEFVEDSGYSRPEFWLADGWAVVQQEQWRAPLYWLERDGVAQHYTLCGLQPRDPAQPVCHLSGYEADAYASWAGARLPTEFEWEHAAALEAAVPPGFDPIKLHPAAATGAEPLLQLYGDCWQWTGSAYRPYPGFQVAAGAIGEYNGKFMANQWVLRGGSCATQTGHTRATYRNFFYPQDRWQFSGLRLARDL